MAWKPKLYDPDDVKQLRTELLRAGLAIMRDSKEVKKWSAIKKEYVLKVGSRVLPVLNAGRDDDERLIPEPLLGGKSNGISDNNRNRKTFKAEKENS